jgi:hypothetical protein
MCDTVLYNGDRVQTGLTKQLKTIRYSDKTMANHTRFNRKRFQLIDADVHYVAERVACDDDGASCSTVSVRKFPRVQSQPRRTWQIPAPGAAWMSIVFLTAGRRNIRCQWDNAHTSKSTSNDLPQSYRNIRFRGALDLWSRTLDIDLWEPSSSHREYMSVSIVIDVTGRFWVTYSHITIKPVKKLYDQFD